MSYHLGDMTMQLLVLFCLIELCLTKMVTDGIGWSSGDPNIPPYEISALKDLYSATNGDDWWWRPTTTGNKWNFTSPTVNPCEQKWQGLNCTLIPELNTTHITSMVLREYYLNGTLPESMGNFTYLGVLSLSSNRLSGYLPSTLYKLTYLKELGLQDNSLSGPLPAMLGELHELQLLALGLNYFTGTIPPQLSTLSKLQVLILGHNDLRGTIPHQLTMLQRVFMVDLYHTHITGQLPSTLGNMTALRQFNVYNNSLSGPIPSSLGDVAGLLSITLGRNKLTGKLPSSLGNAVHLAYVDVLGNALTGPIPVTYKALTSLQVFYLYENRLSGTLDVLCDMYDIEQVYFTSNEMTGTVPACLGQRQGLTELYVGSNRLTGALPDSLHSLALLEYLEFNNNYLVSTIPASYGQLLRVSSLQLFNNYLTGTVPTSLSQIPYLGLLLIQNNFLSGPIVGLINSTVQRGLIEVLLNGNRFTGGLPEEPFRIPSFSQLSAVDNCLQGSIPAVACECPSLAILALNGMGASKSCSKAMMPGISNSYLSKHSLEGGIPECLFQLPNLTTLHLSGNGITGSLPYELELGDHLIDLALSHNTITGSIPRSIQEREWYNLDLSYNRFDGTMLPSFSTKPVTLHDDVTILKVIEIYITYVSDEAQLTLENNRLSGDIPDTVHDLPDISMLIGNLFGCKWSKSNVPRHDAGKSGYQCGSDSFNGQYYLWLVATGLCGLIALVLWRWRLALESRFQRVKSLAVLLESWWEAPKQPAVAERLKNFHHVDRLASVIGTVATLCTAFIMLVLAPAYAVLSKYYKTITYQYAWSVAAIFLSGAVPFAVIVVLLLILLVLTMTAMARQMQKYVKREKLAALSEVDGEGRARLDSTLHVASKKQIYFSHATFFIVSFVIVLGVNVAYVYLVMYASNQYLIFAQVFLAVFKGFWNSLGSVLVMRWAFNQFANGTSGADYHSTLLFASLMNNIAIPCLVVDMISPDCFYSLFVPPAPVQYTYAYSGCAVFALSRCLVHFPEVGVSSFHPPFTYSYECAAQYVISYAPTFVYLAIEVAFLLPILQAWRAQQIQRTRRGTRWFAFLKYTTPQVLQLVDADAAETTLRDKLYLCYDANLYLVQLKTYLGILLTFGAVFPPLAPAMLVAIGSLMATNRLIVGRYIQSAVERDAMHLVDNIDKDCRGVGVKYLRKLKIGVFMLVFFGCCFYALFLFDILGDAEGPDKSFWVMIVFPLLPLMIYALESLRLRWFGPLQELVRLPAAWATSADGLELKFAVPELSEGNLSLSQEDTTGLEGGTRSVLHTHQ